jgi:hypothetical protein
VKLRKPTKRNFDYFWKKFGVFPQTVVSRHPRKKPNFAKKQQKRDEYSEKQTIFAK